MRKMNTTIKQELKLLETLHKFNEKDKKDREIERPLFVKKDDTFIFQYNENLCFRYFYNSYENVTDFLKSKGYVLCNTNNTNTNLCIYNIKENYNNNINEIQEIYVFNTLVSIFHNLRSLKENEKFNYTFENLKKIEKVYKALGWKERGFIPLYRHTKIKRNICLNSYPLNILVTEYV